MKRFLVLILIIITAYYTFGGKAAKYNIYQITPQIGAEYEVHRPNMTANKHNSDSLHIALIIIGVFMAIAAAILFGWRFNHFAVAIIATAVFAACIVVGGLLNISPTDKSIEKAIETDKSLVQLNKKAHGFYKTAQLIEYFRVQQLSDSKIIELSNRADFHYVTGKMITNNKAFETAVRNVSGKDFDITKKSLRDHYNEIDEGIDFYDQAKKIKKEYIKLAKQNEKNAENEAKEAKKLERKQKIEDAKINALKKIEKGLNKLSDVLEEN